MDLHHVNPIILILCNLHNPLPYKYQQPELVWKSLGKATDEDFDRSPSTAIDESELMRLFNKLMNCPADFKPLKKVEKLLQDKIKLLETEQKIDWATAELLAYPSILVDVEGNGRLVRKRQRSVAARLHVRDAAFRALQGGVARRRE